MKLVDVLMQEHRVIEGVLDALESYARRLKSPETPDPADLGRFVRFVREYADARHHGKEEDLLFVALAAHGFSREAGPLAVMLAEHEQGRRLVGVLAGVAEAPRPWTGMQRAEAAEAALEFSAMLRAHIFKEDNILYPAARGSLPPEVQERLDADALRIDAARREDGEEDEIEALGRSLVERYAEGARV